MANVVKLYDGERVKMKDSINGEGDETSRGEGGKDETRR